MKNFLIIGLISLIAGAAGFVFYQQTTDRSATVSAPQTSVQTSALGDAVAATAEANTGSGARPMATTLPEFSLKNRAGEMQSVRSWPGKSMIVNFWATWCGPCRKEIPLLKEISKAEAKSGFQIVGIAIDFRDEVLKYADEMKMDYPLLIGEQDGLAAADAFGVSSVGLPFTAFTDQKGRIVTMLMGELTREKAKIILAAVKRVNKGELTPESARAAIASDLLKLPANPH